MKIIASQCHFNTQNFEIGSALQVMIEIYVCLQLAHLVVYCLQVAHVVVYCLQVACLVVAAHLTSSETMDEVLTSVLKSGLSSFYFAINCSSM